MARTHVAAAACMLVVCTFCSLLPRTAAFGGRFSPAPPGGVASVRMTGDALWVVNLTAESDAVRMAVRDVQEDWYKVRTGAMGSAAVLHARVWPAHTARALCCAAVTTLQYGQ